ncbi:MAG: hypothetical protein ABH834_05160 [Candidatus Altiarchaeota archaeon]
MEKGLYSKKISSEEARCGFILILKDKRKMFPESGKRFELNHHGNKFPVVVDEIACECVGPEKPHVHFHLHIPVKLSKGDFASIKEEDGSYVLEIKS